MFKWLAVGFVVLCALLAAVAAGAGYVLFAADPNLAERARSRVAQFTEKPVERLNEQSFGWERLETTLVTLEKTEIELGNVDGSVTGGSIDLFGDTVVYVAANGIVGFLDLDQGEIEYVESRVPMQFDYMIDNYFIHHLRFIPNWYRVTDIMVRPDGSDANRAELLVAHYRYTPEDDEMCLYISAQDIGRDAEGNAFVAEGEWRQVIRTTACVTMEELDWFWPGLVGGARMVEYEGDTILLSVGTADLGALHGMWNYINESSGNDYGKIITVNTLTGESSHYAYGFRNPQGLAWDKDGRLWESEHGPAAGDEVNIVKEGKHYGWPHVTLGTEYGSPRALFHHMDSYARHDGYEQPAVAFMPSVGPSQLFQVIKGKGLEAWEGDMLLSTLHDQVLVRIRTDGDKVVYTELIPLERRMRDAMQLADGSLAFLTARKTLLIVRGAGDDPVSGVDSSTPDPEPYVIAGYDALQPLEISAKQVEQRFSWGRMLYAGKCASCHSIDGSPAAGPTLKGVLGRDIASIDGYPYSDALMELDRKWDRDSLVEYMSHPDSFAPGTYMPAPAYIDVYQARAVVDFLREVDEGAYGNADAVEEQEDVAAFQ